MPALNQLKSATATIEFTFALRTYRLRNKRVGLSVSYSYAFRGGHGTVSGWRLVLAG
jgi:hypothetical protein